MTMPAGTYYVGDLCYVMHLQWDEFCVLTIEDDGVHDGEFTLKNGVKFAFKGTAYGDGSYEDQHGNDYSVDTGLIGCILMSDIDDPEVSKHGESYIMDLGQVITFPEPFEVSSASGVIHFGDVVSIDTTCEYEEAEMG